MLSHLAICLTIISCAYLCAAKVPIVVLNGVAGTVVYAQLNKPGSEHKWCSLHSNWYRIWLNVDELAPGVIDCTTENLAMSFDPKSKTYFNAIGVLINATSDFGGFNAMSYLDPSLKILEPYMATLVAHFESLGYKQHVDLLGAPYDWRMAADAQGAYFARLQQLIELAVQQNKSPAVLVGHSMGGLMSLKFLQRQTEEWKQMYIKAYMPVDAPFGGAVNALMGVVSGYSFGVKELPHAYLRNLQTQTPSMGWFLPIAGSGTDGTYGKTTVVLSTPSKNYTAYDIEQILTDEAQLPFLAMYRETSPLLSLAEFGAPGVDTHIVYGYNVSTTCGLRYAKDLVANPKYIPDAPVNMFLGCNGDGDGTVPINSLQRGELTWASDPAMKGHKMDVSRFQGMSHMGAVRDSRTIAVLQSLVGL